MQTNETACSGSYNISPGFPVGAGKIFRGLDALADRLSAHRRVIIDGYGGVLWESLRSHVQPILSSKGLKVTWLDFETALLPEAEIGSLVAPYLGGEDPLFGRRFTGHLLDFYHSDQITSFEPDPQADLTILYGCGAALADWDGLLVYVDVPKDEIQLRSRSGKITNLGVSVPETPRQMYKRFYFVDWIVLNRHKAEILPKIDWFVDGQDQDNPTLIAGPDLRLSIYTISRNYFRVQPWFEPGPWGGQWMKEHIAHIAQDRPNFAWSFELIAPENGLLLERDGHRLEFSFDLLMFQEYKAVLGDCAERFKFEFPIRFDFLDTFSGGNLSVQCHPRPEYARQHFGESFTQDEAYYILDCKPDARVFLGFCEDIDPQAFRDALDTSYAHAVPVDVDKYVNTEKAHRHDLFLIPSGTIHCSGADNLVLEISSTPYIFTFKMYDWLRLDLDGMPRPLNIQRAFDNLCFERKGERVRDELIARPKLVSSSKTWQLYHLPTHPDHFYDVYRVHFTGTVELPTNNACQVMNLVEGTAVELITPQGLHQCFNYAETFVVPAAADHFSLRNLGETPAWVVMAMVKKEAANPPTGG